MFKIDEVRRNQMVCKEIIDFLKKISPEKYAMEWDNVGLLVGREDRIVNSILISLDATNEVISEAGRYDMLITHHPLIFSKINRINSSNVLGNKILSLIEDGVSYYAMHTNFDVCGSMSIAVANKIEFECKAVLEETIDQMGIGVIGNFKSKLNNYEICQLIKNKFDLKNVILHGEKHCIPSVVAISPGSGKSVIRTAAKLGVQCLITGDIGHHEAQDALEMGLSIIDASHYGLEKVFVEYIYDLLIDKFPELKIDKYDIPPKIEVV